MKLIELKCPSCGSNLKVNKELKSFTCNFCGTTTLLDDEVVRVEHRIVGTKKKERIDGLEALVDDKRYDLAIDKAKKLTEDYPQESRVWLALLRALTEDFTRKYDYLNEYFEQRHDAENYSKTFRKKGMEAAHRLKENKLTWEKTFEYYSKYENDKDKLLEITQKYNEFNNKYQQDKAEYLENEAKRVKKEKSTKATESIILTIACIVLFIFATATVSNNTGLSIACYVAVGCIMYFKKDAFRKIGININIKTILIIFVVGLILYFAVIRDYVESYKYDYVLDCSNLQKVNLIDIYNLSQKDEKKANEKYLNKSFIFEAKLYSKSLSSKVEPYIQVEMGDLHPWIYINPSEKEKLSNYKEGDKVKFCGIVVEKSFGDSVRIENATIIK